MAFGKMGGLPREKTLAMALSARRGMRSKMARGGLVEESQLNHVPQYEDEEDELNRLSGKGGGSSVGDSVAHYDPASPGLSRAYDHLAEPPFDPSGPRDALIGEPHEGEDYGHLFMATDFHSFEDAPEEDAMEQHPLAAAMKRRRMMAKGGYC